VLELSQQTDDRGKSIMRVLTCEHNGIEYEFRLLEASRVIQVTKGDTFMYTLSMKGRLFVCTCPGYTYHGKCWHRGMVSEVINSPRINEPWAIWAEEAEVWKTKHMKNSRISY